MADNLALKLLVAGIIGAVIGAAAAERYHFPTGLVYGGMDRPSAYRTRPAIDPLSGSGRADRADRADRGGDRADREDGPRIVLESPPAYYYPPPPPRYRPPPRRPLTAWCWREFEDWNFRTTGHFVRCPASGAGSRARDDG
jgi:hypothetical protein